jgi:hypothetical protein
MIILNRMASSIRDDGLYGHFGQLKLYSKKSGALEIFTHEKPWIQTSEFPNGKVMDSCIPVGTYSLEKVKFLAYNDAKFVLFNDNNVFKRSSEMSSPNQRYGTIFVTGDPFDHAEGVISVGLSLSTKKGKRHLEHSAVAYKQLHKFLTDNPQENLISITWAK